MRVEVLQTFRDARTGEMLHPGRVLDVDEKRAATMAEAGLARPLEEAKGGKRKKTEE